jgi:hypothetical protein
LTRELTAFFKGWIARLRAPDDAAKAKVNGAAAGTLAELFGLIACVDKNAAALTRTGHEPRARHHLFV